MEGKRKRKKEDGDEGGSGMRRRDRERSRRGRIGRLAMKIVFSLIGAVLLFYLIVLITAWI